MRPVSLLLIYLAIVFTGAAVISPWVFQLCQFLADQNSFFVPLAKFPFHRFVNRSLLFLTLLGLWPFLRALGIRSWSDLGFSPPRLHWKKIGRGFLVGFFSLATVATLALCFGARTIGFRQSLNMLVVDLLGATLAAVVVAILEETLFRGALFGALRKNNAWPVALFVSSAIYALLHFFAKPESPSPIHWNSGFITLASMCRGFGDLETLLPGFFNLFIVGAILALAFQFTGNLYFSIGLHAGWIFWVKSYGLLTTRGNQNNSNLWGTGKIIDGWIATSILLVVFWVLFFRYQNQKRIIDVA